jgi:hypothetical protein
MQELLNELAAIKTVEAELKARLVEATQAAKVALVNDLRATILAAGFEIPEIASLLRGPSTKTTKGNGKTKPSTAGAKWALNTDPSKVYTRGPTPSWMKQAMAATGLNANQDQRRQFMAEHMSQV